ncbi:MAG: M20/M25/M40 family metallo-hydrolase [Thermoanaerobaculia bacterium]
MSLVPRSRGLRRRLVVYGLLAASVAGLVAATWWIRHGGEVDADTEWIARDWAAEPAVRLLREYVRIDTSAATGNEQAGAEWLAGKLRAAGIEPHVERLGKRSANLWAVIEGERREALVLHHHIDVADIEHPELWAHPPFAAVYDPPWLVGRGVFDMKSLAVAQLTAFLELARAGRRPELSVVLLATGDEETGSRLGTEWLLRRHPELAERFWAVLTEGGVVEAIGPDQIKFWGIEVAQKRFADGVFCAASRERLEHLREDLEEHSRQPPFPLSLAPEVDAVLRAYAPTRGRPELAAAMRHPQRTLTDAAAFRDLPAYVQAMFRAELHPMQIEEAPGGGYRLPFVLHLPPGVELEETLPGLLPAWMTAGVAWHVEEARGADGGSPLAHPVPRELRRAIERIHPGAPVGPWLLPWTATDARFFRRAGVPSYGFSPFLVVAAETYSIDGPNERMSMPGFVRGVDLYVDVVRRIVERGDREEADSPS